MNNQKREGLDQVGTVKTVSARGNRLFPSKYSRTYWCLTKLRETYEAYAEIVGVGTKAPVLLDYGCGNMPYRPVFEAKMANYIGADLEGNPEADLILGSDGQIPLADQSCDIVLSSQVLEHVANPKRYLAEAHRVLRKNGVLLLSTHGVWRYHPDPTDFWRWTSAGLKREVEEAGFTVTRWSGILGPEATGWQLWQDAAGERIPSRLRPLFYRYAQWRMRRADQRCSETVRSQDASVYVLMAECR